MPVTFYGKWSLDVIGNVGDFDQRVRIVGSAASDGSVSGAVSVRLPFVSAGTGSQQKNPRCGIAAASGQQT
jgi:hypothetical protein